MSFMVLDKPFINFTQEIFLKKKPQRIKLDELALLFDKTKKIKYLVSRFHKMYKSYLNHK